jgi:hypothetical protein
VQVRFGALNAVQREAMVQLLYGVFCKKSTRYQEASCGAACDRVRWLALHGGVLLFSCLQYVLDVLMPEAVERLYALVLGITPIAAAALLAAPYQADLE